MRRLLFSLCAVLLVGVSGACSNDELENLTKDQPCAGDADCAPSQSCVVTPSESAFGLTVGLCTAESCVDGAQLGCGCTASSTCNAPHEGYPANITCDPEVPQRCKFQCTLDNPDTDMVDESVACPGGVTCRDPDPNDTNYEGVCDLPG